MSKQKSSSLTLNQWQKCSLSKKNTMSSNKLINEFFAKAHIGFSKVIDITQEQGEQPLHKQGVLIVTRTIVTNVPRFSVYKDNASRRIKRQYFGRIQHS